VGFECADCTFCFVPAVHVRWDKLMLAVPFMGDAVDVCSASFVVEDLGVNFEATRFEAFHDDVVCWNTMMIRFSLEGLDKDDVGGVMVCEHDVLVTAQSTDGEAAHIVGEESRERDFDDVEFIGRGSDGVERCRGWLDLWTKCLVGWHTQNGGQCRGTWRFGGTETLLDLGHVTKYGGCGIFWAVAGNIGG